MQKKNLSTELTDTNKEVVEEVLAIEQSVKPSQGEDVLSKNEDKREIRHPRKVEEINKAYIKGQPAY